MRRLFRIGVPLLVVCALSSRAASGQTVSYVYDELGRLIAVSDPTGETAIYSYDAVGNVLSIERRSASTLSLIHFTPGSGPTATTVTIYGTGFGTTPAQNTVTFNGTSATVSSATLTQLVVTVPSGATTGPIGVTTSGGSVQSSTNFVVGAGAPNAPTITSVSPSIGEVGTSVTITGTNFDAVPANNRTAFNIRLANSSIASTTTQIATTVPFGGTSGHVHVTTAAGEAQSSSDFFVPPAPFVVSDVASTGRLALNTPFGASVPTANKIALVVFDANQGQRLNLQASGPSGAVKLNRPDGTLLAGLALGIFTAFTDVQIAPTTGAYTILVDPSGSGTGTTNLTVYEVPPDVTGTLTANGAGLAVPMLTPGQNAHLTFQGTLNERISVKASGGPTAPLVIKKPDGSTLASTTVTLFGAFVDTTVLPDAGSYAVDIDPTGGGTGTITVNMYEVPADASATIATDGSPTTLAMNTPGQNGVATFAGTAGQRISLKAGFLPAGNLQLLKPDQSQLTSMSIGTVVRFLEPIALPTTGTYSIKVDPSSAGTGTATLNLYDVPADASGTLTVNGGTVPVTLGAPGQNGAYTFAGTNAQTVTVRVTSNTMGSVLVKLLKPDGSTLTSSTSSLSSFNLTQQTLPTTGTYTVVVDPSSWNTGGLNLAVTNP